MATSSMAEFAWGFKQGESGGREGRVGGRRRQVRVCSGTVMNGPHAGQAQC